MTPEVWAFLGVAVTALAGIVVVIIQNRKQGRQLTDVPDDDADPTLRAMVASVLAELAQGRIAEAQYHAEQDAKIDSIASDVKDVRSELTDLRGIVLTYHPEAAS